MNRTGGWGTGIELEAGEDKERIKGWGTGRELAVGGQE